MNLHLFSIPGKNDIRDILEAARPYLQRAAEPVVAYLPAAATGYNWLDYTEKAFAGLGAIRLIDTERMALAEMEAILDSGSVVYISGGNTYLLNHRLHQSGLMPLLRQRILTGLPVVAFSAGSILCGPNVLITQDMNTLGTTHFKALDLLAYGICAHYPGDEPARIAFDEWLREYHLFNPQPILAMEDGAYLHVAGGAVTAARGNCWLLPRDGERRQLEAGSQLPARPAEMDR
jgi:dipeptidase E